MKKILILYFSGVGNTKYVAEYMYSKLKKNVLVDIRCIEEVEAELDICRYDKIILGTPTIHSEPAKPVKDYLADIKPLKKPIPAFIFATYGLYPENVLRVLADLCIAKNIVPVKYSGYRCRANDGSLLFPFIKFLNHNEKYIERKMKRDIDDFINHDTLKLNRPRYKLYGLLNYPNKWMGQHYHFKIFLHNEHCIKCGKCVINCPRKAISQDVEGYPVIDMEECMNCYRCIYHCPVMALSLYKKKRHRVLRGD